MCSFPISLPNLLTGPEVAQIQSLLQTTPFEEGKNTAFGAANAVKDNWQVPRGEDPNYLKIASIFSHALNNSPLFQAVAMPKAIVPPLISRYEPGQQYGFHVDSPHMGGDGIFRTDLGMTVFLNDPQDYDGGELDILLPSGEMKVKLKAGDAILYPTLFVHGVLPVTRGRREVMVTWVHSLVNDPLQRDILFQLNSLYHQYQQKLPAAPENLNLQQVHSNLMRMWSNA